MSVFHRLGNLISEDMAAIVPGSGTPLNRETGLRLLMYAALLLFVLTLMLPGIFAPRAGGLRDQIAPPARITPESSQPEPKIEERQDVRESEQI
ncbi:MAG: hypothetical protein NXI24_05590 [bacterium]|nr:hypothetical protein [bacterium]